MPRQRTLIDILGVSIDVLRRDQAQQEVRSLLEEPKPHFITTPNPEILVAASKDESFRTVLNSADLAIADGFGLVLAALYKRLPLPTRISGVDFMDDIAAIAAEKGRTMFLLGASDGVARKAAEALIARHPNLRVVGAESGGRVERDASGEWRISPNVYELLRRTHPDILLVAFGHGPQESWLRQELPRLPFVRIAMGVGGAFDFLAGTQVRAPRILRLVGLEWLWRLANEPKRWRRILNAIAVFPWLVISSNR